METGVGDPSTIPGWKLMASQHTASQDWLDGDSLGELKSSLVAAIRGWATITEGSVGSSVRYAHKTLVDVLEKIEARLNLDPYWLNGELVKLSPLISTHKASVASVTNARLSGHVQTGDELYRSAFTAASLASLLCDISVDHAQFYAQRVIKADPLKIVLDIHAGVRSFDEDTTLVRASNMLSMINDDPKIVTPATPEEAKQLIDDAHR